ncbi:MAG: hypothetical protein JF609_04885 [Verrucomicrobia bacterium]|nr:hypothetical protein [Verrucomicrobiota bacterium]
MKTKTILVSLSACLMAVSFTACDKKSGAETPAAPATNAATPSKMDTAKTAVGNAMDTAKDATAKAIDTAKDATGKAVDTAKDATAKAVDSTKEVAGKVADTVTDATVKATDAVKGALTPSATESATAQFTQVVADAKKMIADKNYQGALDELKKLSDVKLTDDQQKIVDDLKAEAQKLLSAGA